MYLNLDFKDILQDLRNIDFFEEVNVPTWEYIIEEWKIDDNVYVILDWKFSILKHIPWKWNKILNYVWIWDILWEQALNNPKQIKKVWVRALYNSKILKIKSKDIPEFTEKYTDLWMKLLYEIINLWNKRLSNLNLENSYIIEFSSFINSISEINKDIIWKISDKINEFISSDYTVFIKNHQVLKWTYVSKFDSRLNWKVPNTIIEKDWVFLNLDKAFRDLNIDENHKIVINKISIWDEELGYIFYVRKNDIFLEYEKNILKNFSSYLPSIIKDLEIKEENKSIDLFKKYNF